MVQKAANNPYEPGFGTSPKYLAGRVLELRTINTALERIIEPRGKDKLLSVQPKVPIVLVGPRGVGKTVLLTYADDQAAKLGIPSILINKDMLEGDIDNLCELVAPVSTVRSATNKVKNVEISVAGLGTKFDLRDTRGSNNLKQAFRTRLRKKPLLLIMDEVHTYQRDYLRSLFVIIQELIMKRYPLAVIMAGTPGMMGLLHSCGASFVERSEVMRMNILNVEDTKAALTEPAKQSNLPIETDALELLVKNSDCYPYFIQVLGKEAWDVANDAGHSEITLADAEQGITLALTKRNGFYSGRYNELMQRQLLEHAVHTIRWMGETGGTIPTYQLLNNFIKHDNMDMTKALEIYNELMTIGFIWEVETRLEPGIPSLFSFVADKMAEAQI